MMHKELFVIHKKRDSSQSGKSKHYRLKTKRQLVYVVAGGTSIEHAVPYKVHNIVSKDGKDYLQISQWYYEKNQITFDQVMTYQDEQKLKREELFTPALDSLFSKIEHVKKVTGAEEATIAPFPIIIEEEEST